MFTELCHDILPYRISDSPKHLKVATGLTHLNQLNAQTQMMREANGMYCEEERWQIHLAFNENDELMKILGLNTNHQRVLVNTGLKSKVIKVSASGLVFLPHRKPHTTCG